MLLDVAGIWYAHHHRLVNVMSRHLDTTLARSEAYIMPDPPDGMAWCDGYPVSFALISGPHFDPLRAGVLRAAPWCYCSRGQENTAG